jgi:hypothetical protein
VRTRTTIASFAIGDGVVDLPSLFLPAQITLSTSADNTHSFSVLLV